jgi:hypothetical protein
MWDGINNRRFPRIEAQCDVQIIQEKNKKILKANVENVGIGGVCLILNEPLVKHEIVNLKIMLKTNLAPIQCQGKVVWMIEKKTFDAKGKEKEFDTGIEFVGISEWDRNILRTTINQLATK